VPLKFEITIRPFGQSVTFRNVRRQIARLYIITSGTHKSWAYGFR